MRVAYLLPLFILTGCTTMATTIPDNASSAVFAGGCFWCMEASFQEHQGVYDAVSGYTGGALPNPSYDEVSSGLTGHYEAIKVHYDPKKTSYEELLDVFWQNIDPTDTQGQFADQGSQYRTAIFYADEKQKSAAEESRTALEASGKFDKPIATQILPAGTFYEAESYHQDYYLKKSGQYQAYKEGSGREAFIQQTWGAPQCGLAMPIENLTALQYEVTQKGGTEPAFRNEYWDNHEDGIYIDIVSGKPLFSSKDKYDSGTGWPSFTKPLEPENIEEDTDRALGISRTEVHSTAGTHLGHVFADGPKDRGGMRYCMNSASLRFIPKEDLEKEGYGQYRSLFEE